MYSHEIWEDYAHQKKKKEAFTSVDQLFLDHVQIKS